MSIIKSTWQAPWESLWEAPSSLPQVRGDRTFWDFEDGDKAISSFTRSGGGTAWTKGGLLKVFGANEPRVTDNGLLLEGAETNLFNYWAPTVAQLPVKVNASDVAEPTGAPVTGYNWLNPDNSLGLAASYPACNSIPSATQISLRCLMWKQGGSPPTFGTTAAEDFSVVGASGQQFSSRTVSFRNLGNSLWEMKMTGVTPTPNPSIYCGILRSTTNLQTPMKFSGFHITLGPTIGSHIITTGNAATRGADAASLQVPPDCTKWEATYGDSRTVVSGSGLTPLASFDLIAGRPWIGLGNELKSIRFKP